jgi:hypothetical protein
VYQCAICFVTFSQRGRLAFTPFCFIALYLHVPILRGLLPQYAGYWQTTDFLKSIKEGKEEMPIKFYDSVTGKLLFTAPAGRTMEEFLVESQKHGTFASSLAVAAKRIDSRIAQ